MEVSTSVGAVGKGGSVRRAARESPASGAGRATCQEDAVNKWGRWVWQVRSKQGPGCGANQRGRKEK